jgi:hypothetical protein
VNPLHCAAIRGLAYLQAGLPPGLQADTAPHNSGPDFGKASPFGLLVVVLLLISTMFLMRSMNRHLRKLPDSFDPRNPAPDQAGKTPDEAVDDGTIGDEPVQKHPDGPLPDEPDR